MHRAGNFSNTQLDVLHKKPLMTKHKKVTQTSETNLIKCDRGYNANSDH